MDVSYNGYLRSLKAIDKAGKQPRCLSYALTRNLNGESKIHGIRAHGMIMGCCSSLQKDRSNVFFSGPAILSARGAFSGIYTPRISRLRFNQYVKWLKTLDSEIAALIDQYPPTYTKPFIYLGCESGYKNYLLMCLWRYMWDNPKRSISILRLNTMRYTPMQCIVLSLGTAFFVRDQIFPNKCSILRSDFNTVVEALEWVIEQSCLFKYSMHDKMFGEFKMPHSFFPGVTDYLGFTAKDHLFHNFLKDGEQFHPSMLESRSLIDKAFQIK